MECTMLFAGLWHPSWRKRNAIIWRTKTTCCNSTCPRQKSFHFTPWRSYLSLRYRIWKGKQKMHHAKKKVSNFISCPRWFKKLLTRLKKAVHLLLSPIDWVQCKTWIRFLSFRMEESQRLEHTRNCWLRRVSMPNSGQSKLVHQNDQ